MPGIQDQLNGYESEKQPLVSIISAVYNAEKYLEESILSITAQSYKNFEYIIIDGGSTDNTLNIINKYQDKITYWISEPDNGIYDAWNKGLEKCKGDWIAFIGADDLLYPNSLQIYIEHITQHPKRQELEFVSSLIELVDERLTPLRIVGEAWSWNHFKKNMSTWHVGMFHSKNLFLKYGMFDSTFKVSGDYELLLRPKDKLMASFVNQPTAKMRTGGISSLLLLKASKETYRAKVKNGILSKTKSQLLSIIDILRLNYRGLFS
ncbi:glycosyltransferase family 2 protein [Spirosoma fluviale]|uniref:Glycosyl transferase family 2 n=1 Tax=Spirosoma fluviale TaxID=1597977 RepID=A0A286GHY8_9BACT|nr:glycosyltransferase family 2 protein [Spirosoma fluviale]SOD95092.1 Glycosyl transferase family 2 [Spirosoma fluviale]